MLEISFPRLSCLHGVEHKASLFFDDSVNIPVIKDTIKRRNRIYMVFGSGTFHSSHAVFTEHAKSFNKGRSIGLLRATDTRMAGYFMAMCRDLRMRQALVATVSSATFSVSSKKDKEVRAAQDIHDLTLWKRMYIICKVTLPALLILRLADSNSPGMDKLLFYVHQFWASLEAHGEMLDDEELFPPDDQFEVDEQLAKDTFDMPDGGGK